MRYAETAVAMLLFTCPNTNRKAPTGVEMDVQGLRAQWKARLKLDCPYCSDVHDICVREVYINGALDNLDQTLPPAALLSAAVEANVRWTVRQVLESTEGAARAAQGDMMLVGAVYDLATGRVRFLE